MKKPYRSVLSVALSLSLSSMAWAESSVLAEGDTSSPAPAQTGPTLSSILGNSGIDVKGYLDATYIGHNQNPNPNIQVFDTQKNSFGLPQAGITVSKMPKEGFGGLINLTAGSDAGIYCSYGACGTLGMTPGSGGNFDLTQAYGQYAKGSYTTIVGKFVTLAGAEVIDPTQDTNITRSILFGKIPFTHTGFRVTDALTDSINVMGGVNNGWDQVTGMTSSKTVELGMTDAFTKDTSLAVSMYSGYESMNMITSSFTPTAGVGGVGFGVQDGNRTLIDTVFTSNLTPKATVILNADYVLQVHADINGTPGSERYWGAAGYLNYQWTDQWHTSLRAEDINDMGGIATEAFVTGPNAGGNNLEELTLTAGYSATSNVELRGEVRGDSTTKGVFFGANGSVLYNHMITYGLEALYKF